MAAAPTREIPALPIRKPGIFPRAKPRYVRPKRVETKEIDAVSLLTSDRS
jgi:hypothetical protein